MNFFKALFALCSGTSVFKTLKDVSPIRAAFHLVLMILIAAVITSVFHTLSQRTFIRGVANRFQEATGGAAFGKSGIVLLKEPQKPQTCLVPKKFRFSYFPGTTFQTAGIESPEEIIGIFGFNNGLIFWSKEVPGNADSYQAVALRSKPLYSLLQGTAVKESFDLSKNKRSGLTFAQLCEFSKASLLNGESKLKEPDYAEKLKKDIMEAKPVFLLNASAIYSNVIILTALFTGFYTLCEIVFLVLTALFIFGSVQYFRFKVLKNRLSYSQMLAVTGYMTFPPLLIASLFSFVEIPFLSFQMLFFISFFLYQIHAFTAIAREMNPNFFRRQDPPDDDENNF